MIEYRPASASDAEAIAHLHARSWRENYRGSFHDSFLDGDLPAERLGIWRERLDQPPRNQLVQVAVDGTNLAGFVCPGTQLPVHLAAGGPAERPAGDLSPGDALTHREAKSHFPPMRRCFSLHAMLVALLLLAADSDGAMITISVQGELTSIFDAGPYLAPSMVPGAPFEASFSLESVGPDGNLDPSLGTYGGAFGSWSSDATVGDFSFSGPYARLSVYEDRNVSFEGSLVTGDAMFLDFDFVVFPGIPCVTNFTIIIIGKCHNFTLSFIDPTSDLFISDAFPAAIPDLEEWGSVTLSMGMASGGAPGFAVTGTVHALTVVPEPSSGFLLACGFVALAKRRRRERSG